MTYFAEVRNLLSKTDGIQIILSGNEEELYENYLTIEHVPDKYNSYEVCGIGNSDSIETGLGFADKGLEVLLKKPGSLFSRETSKKGEASQ